MATPQTPTPIATFFIGGAADKSRFMFIAPVTNLIKKELIIKYFRTIRENRLAAVEVNKNEDDAYYGYDEMDELFITIQQIHKTQPAVQIRLIGHSLGGWQAAKLTERLAKASITTALLITIDPVGIGYFRQTARPFLGIGMDGFTPPRPVAATWINILAAHTVQYDRDDLVADAGVRWQPYFDSTLKKQPNGDYRTPYSHAEIFKMMTFPGAASRGAWALLLMEPI